MSGNFWVLAMVSSAFAETSCKKDHKLYLSECVVFLMGLVSCQFIYYLVIYWLLAFPDMVSLFNSHVLMGLTLQSNLVFNSKVSYCISLLDAVIKGMCHHATTQ